MPLMLFSSSGNCLNYPCGKNNLRYFSQSASPRGPLAYLLSLEMEFKQYEPTESTLLICFDSFDLRHRRIDVIASNAENPCIKTG